MRLCYVEENSFIPHGHYMRHDACLVNKTRDYQNGCMHSYELFLVFKVLMFMILHV